MKKPLILLFLFISLSAHAFRLNAHDIWVEGAKLMAQAQKDKIMDYMINPIICANPASGNVELVYSMDSREKDTAYFKAVGSSLQRIPADRLKIQELSRHDQEGGYEIFFVSVLGKLKLTCVQSLIVLETPGR